MKFYLPNITKVIQQTASPKFKKSLRRGKFSCSIKTYQVLETLQFGGFTHLTMLLLLTLLISCNNNSPTKEENKISLPNTPETVSKQWQTHLDKNEIDQAALLSTELTKEWLAENKELFLNDSQIYQTNFVKMDCVEAGKKATCNYTILEEGELIEDFFLLKKINNQWLVDLEEEAANPELDEQIFKQMEKELKLD